MSSEPLFDFADRQRATIGQIVQAEQQENLSRVKNKLSKHVLKFCQGIGVQGRFHATDLLQAVSRAVAPMQVSPDSPVRILRDLRQSGELDYTIVNRRQSLYELTDLRVHTASSIEPTSSAGCARRL